jgi:hypothetical protein
MVSSALAISSFEDLPIAQTLAKMSLSDEEKKEKSVRPCSRVEDKMGMPTPAKVDRIRKSCLKKNTDNPSLTSSTNTRTTNTTSATARKSRKVSFRSIEIRYYQMTMGDNPACSIGPPVQLDWHWDHEEMHDVDIYEVERRPRRKVRHLVLSYYRRKQVLMSAGFDESQQKAAERQIGKLKRQRKTTGLLLPIQKMEEVVQSASRKVRRGVGSRKKKEIR